MTTNLSQKLFTQKDGKRFAYADEIKKAVEKLKEFVAIKGANNPKLKSFIEDFWEEIEEIFGKELTQ